MFSDIGNVGKSANSATLKTKGVGFIGRPSKNAATTGRVSATQYDQPPWIKYLTYDFALSRLDTKIDGRYPAEVDRRAAGANNLPWPDYSPNPMLFNNFNPFRDETDSPVSSEPSIPPLNHVDPLLSISGQKKLSQASVPVGVPRSKPVPTVKYHALYFPPILPTDTPKRRLKCLSHVIGEWDECCPFPPPDDSYEDQEMARLLEWSRNIEAPVPQVPIAAALARFEDIVLEAEEDEHKEEEPKANDENFTIHIDRKEADTAITVQNAEKISPPQTTSKYGACLRPLPAPEQLLYETGPQPSFAVASEMIAVLLDKSGPAKTEKMKKVCEASGDENQPTPTTTKRRRVRTRARVPTEIPRIG